MQLKGFFVVTAAFFASSALALRSSSTGHGHAILHRQLSNGYSGRVDGLISPGAGRRAKRTNRHQRRQFCIQANQPAPAEQQPPQEQPQTLPAPELAPAPAPAPELAPPPAPAPQPAPAPAPAPQPGIGDLAEAYLSEHNTARARHGAAPLSWSDELAGKAQQWANNCAMRHSGGQLGQLGENLAAGSGDSMDARAAVQAWVEEVVDYDPRNPQASHFTQVVWKGTSEVGCAFTTCPPGSIFSGNFGTARFHVCEYRAPGNVAGGYAANVQV